MIKLFVVNITPYYVSLTIAFRAPDLEKDLPEIPQEQLPRCKKADCNGLLRPYIVWFGENLHEDALSKASKSFQINILIVYTMNSTLAVHKVSSILAQRHKEWQHMQRLIRHSFVLECRSYSSMFCLSVFVFKEKYLLHYKVPLCNRCVLWQDFV